MAKIVILGAGSIGCWIGGHLIAGGANVTLIGRARFAGDIAENGLRLTHFERPDIYLESVDFQTNPEALKGADIVALCVKSQDTQSAAEQILSFAPTAQVVSFQNGIRNPETLNAILSQAAVAPAIVPFNVTPTGPGAFHCGTAGPLIIENKGGSIEALRQALEAAGQPVLLKESILGDQWAKMIVNLNNGLNTLAGGTLKAGLLQRDYRLALAACVEEAIAVAQQSDVTLGKFNGRPPSMLVKTLRLPNWAYRIIMQRIVKIDAKARSSMLDDLEGGRLSEVEYLQGEIVRQAQKTRSPVPCNQAILNAVLGAFSKGKSPQLSGTEILGLFKR